MKGRLLILKTGDLPPRVIAKHGPYERQFINCMRAEDQVVVVDARQKPVPEGKWAGILITGSASSAYDRDPWIRECSEFLKRAEEDGTPIYGVCFGHQLLAQTFGGKVEKCVQGWELGTTVIRLTSVAENDKLFAGMPVEFLAQQTHGDVVSDLPRGAVRLAGNDHAPVQAFRLGEKIWGTQFHPEFSMALMRDMVEVLARDLSRENFPLSPPDQPLREWLLSRLREGSKAVRCVQNFVKRAVLLLGVFLVGFTGCSSGSKNRILVHPSTGRAVRCDLLSGDTADKCVQAAEKRGYVLPEKLTAEQRSKFQRQGLVPFDHLTPEERAILNQGLVPKQAGPSIP